MALLPGAVSRVVTAMIAIADSTAKSAHAKAAVSAANAVASEANAVRSPAAAMNHVKRVNHASHVKHVRRKPAKHALRAKRAHHAKIVNNVNRAKTVNSANHVSHVSRENIVQRQRHLVSRRMPKRKTRNLRRNCRTAHQPTCNRNPLNAVNVAAVAVVVVAVEIAAAANSSTITGMPSTTTLPNRRPMQSKQQTPRDCHTHKRRRATSRSAHRRLMRTLRSRQWLAQPNNAKRRWRSQQVLPPLRLPHQVPLRLPRQGLVHRSRRLLSQSALRRLKQACRRPQRRRQVMLRRSQMSVAHWKQAAWYWCKPIPAKPNPLCSPAKSRQSAGANAANAMHHRRKNH